MDRAITCGDPVVESEEARAGCRLAFWEIKGSKISIRNDQELKIGRKDEILLNCSAESQLQFRDYALFNICIFTLYEITFIRVGCFVY